MAGKYVLGGAGGLISYIAGNYYLDKGEPLHVNVWQPKMMVGGLNILPAMSAIFKSVPQSIRTPLLAKPNAPPAGEIEDWLDVAGEDPYKIIEVKPGKIWQVHYKMSNIFLRPEARVGVGLMGMDWATNEQSAWRVMQGAEQDGREASAQALKDLERDRELNGRLETEGLTRELEKEFGPFPLHMMVVKLNNDDILLYNPVRIRPDSEMEKFLNGLGKVKWVALGSSAHTLLIPSIMKSYPDATLIGPKDAWTKLKYAPDFKKEKLDFEYTNSEDLDRLNNLLSEEGVKFHYIDGDCATSAMVVVAHKTALEVDLVYSLSDGGLFLPKAELNQYEKAEFWNTRLFKWGLCSSPASPNNNLASYRFWMMDPNNDFSSLLLTPPKKDGSSCKDMAASLRKMLADDFDTALGVHFMQMTGDEFRQSIENNWSWLDGKSLLKPNPEP